MVKEKCRLEVTRFVELLDLAMAEAKTKEVSDETAFELEGAFKDLLECLKEKTSRKTLKEIWES